MAREKKKVSCRERSENKQQVEAQCRSTPQEKFDRRQPALFLHVKIEKGGKDRQVHLRLAHALELLEAVADLVLGLQDAWQKEGQRETSDKAEAAWPPYTPVPPGADAAPTYRQRPRLEC